MALEKNTTRTTNNMKAFATTEKNVVDLFFKIGAMRGQDIIPQFNAAFKENPEKAIRIALWARDVREGAGERDLFRKILAHLSNTDEKIARRVINRVADLGRFDDLLESNLSPRLRQYAVKVYVRHLQDGNGLAAKWAPRQGKVANALRSELKKSPKEYRKFLGGMITTVENQMCANQWDAIDYSTLPSKASNNYRKAFYKHSKLRYESYLDALKTGKTFEGKVAKVNAGAIYPYEVIKSLYYGNYSAADRDLLVSQWDALPDYTKGENMLPIVDVSGSMGARVGGSNSNLTAMLVAISTGLYLADKNKGVFNGMFMTFSDNPRLVRLTGGIEQKITQMQRSDWGMSTNLHAAFDNILNVAVKNNVPEGDMPKYVLILSDMQFNCCKNYDDAAIEMIKRKYENAGYTPPKVVFWNILGHDNVPARYDENGTALVSGFSPSILKGILANDLDSFTPENVMLKTIMVDRYNF